MASTVENHETLELAADIVTAYVSKNAIAATSIPELLRTVHSALSSLAGSAPVAPAEAAPAPQRAISVKKSIGTDFLVSFEDGKKYRSLKRHLAVRGLTPEGYRSKWGLPPDYPMVAPSYAEARSAIAKQMGLGRKR